MKRLFRITISLMLTASIILTSLGAGSTASAAQNDSTPVIALTYVPAYGVNSPITGVVFRKDGGSFNAADYRISVFLQLGEGERPWRKPYDTKPYTEIGDDGTFSALFNTGGNDINAKILHIMLIPSSYVPADLEETKGVAIDYVIVTRTEDAGVTIKPNREAPKMPDTQPAINALLPVSRTKIAVDVGFYTDGSGPGSPLSEELIRQQLTAVQAFSDTVRFYGSGGELYKAYKIAHDMGFRIVGTASLSGNKTEDKAEMDALIEHCNNGYVQVACVGNETLLETDKIKPKLKPSELVADINYVRGKLEDSKLPVTTSDSADVLQANSSVRNACNLIMPNCYPYWGGNSIDSAAQAFIESMDALKAVSGGKQILVSETGWPTAGEAFGSAVPNEANAALYFEKIRAWSLSTGTQVLYFDAADEPWKAGPSGEGDVGEHWGFMTTDFKVKDGYMKSEVFKKLLIPGTVQKVYPRNVLSGIKLSWDKVPGATRYHVYRGSKLLVTTSKLEYTDQEVASNYGRKYTYKVVATRTGVGDSLKGRTTTYYRVLPVNIRSLKNSAAGKITVTYDSGKTCTGYVVRYGLKNDMSDAKVITVQGVGTTTKTFSGLKKGKTYYVQVRTYILDDNIRYYSGYCPARTVKIAK